MNVSTNCSLFCLLLASLLVNCPSTSARNWQIGDNGLVRWDSNCDFSGNDIGQQPSRPEQCGGICIANPSCTHFTWGAGELCYMKQAWSLTEINSNGAVCGWVINRSSQPARDPPVGWTASNGRQISQGIHLEWINRDIFLDDRGLWTWDTVLNFYSL